MSNDEVDLKGLKDWASFNGLVHADAVWTLLMPGQTNLVWKVSGSDGTATVLKLYRRHRSTPLFPNDPDAEWCALAALTGTGLGPLPLRTARGPFGQVLTYRYVDTHRQPHVVETAAVLSRLHRLPPPGGLRRLQLDVSVLRNDGDTMISGLPAVLRERLLQCRPAIRPKGARSRVAFLHGDPVASNVLEGRSGTILVDWQCPAKGDPVFDIACALSPSMRINCALRPLSDIQTDAFLVAYGDDATAKTFHAWRAILTWRFACYAGWRIAQGQCHSEAGLAAEIDLLERLENQDQNSDGSTTNPHSA